MRVTVLLFLITAAAPVRAEDLPTDEAGVIAYLRGKGVTIGTNDDGHAVRLMSSGKPPLSKEEYDLIGRLEYLEQMGLNAAPLAEDEWGFLHELPRLKRLSIWHGHEFATLKQFSKLEVESLTIGGCMGLRDKNREDPTKLRNAVTTLRDLPKVTRINLYHSPLLPDDAHLAHIVKECPKLEDAKLDFAAPRGSETSITPEGLRVLGKVPLRVLSLENAATLGPAHFRSLAEVKSLATLLVDARRTPAPTEGIEVLKSLRPDVEVVVAGPDATGPPQPPRRKP